MIAGLLLHLRKNPDSQALRKRIDDEGLTPLREGLSDLLQIRNALAQRFFGRILIINEKNATPAPSVHPLATSHARF